MIYVDADRCSGCGACADACPPLAIAIVDNLATIDRARCDGCQRCLAVCYQGAIFAVSTLLPERRAVPAVAGAPRPLAASRTASLARWLTNGLAPVALDVAVALADRWLSRRSVAVDGGSQSDQLAGRMGRQRRWRWGQRR